MRTTVLTVPPRLAGACRVVVPLVVFAVACLVLAGGNPCASQGQPAKLSRLLARIYDSGFDLAHDSYNGISSASDGKIYYVLSSQDIDVGAQIYSFDPAIEKIRHLGDLTDICGEKGLKAIPQNKSHVRFWEANGKHDLWRPWELGILVPLRSARSPRGGVAAHHVAAFAAKRDER